MFGIIAFIILNLCMVYSWSIFIYKHLINEELLSIKLISISILYLAQISITVLFLGRVIGILNWKSLFLLNIVISLMLIFIRKNNLSSSKVIINDIKTNIKDIKIFKDYVLLIIVMLFIFKLLVILREIVIAPPTVYDVFTYHLHPVIDWYQNQKIMDVINTPVTRTTSMPLGLKLIHFWWIAFWGNTKLIEMPQFIFVIILFFSTFSLMRLIKINKNNAIKYSILIFFMPINLIESSTCQDHLALVTLWIISLIYFIYIFFYKQKYFIWLLAISIGLFLGIKSIAIIYILILIICIVINKLFYKEKIEFKISAQHIKKGIGVLCIIMVIAGYWYIRNFALYGSFNGNFKNRGIELNLSGSSGILGEFYYRMNFLINNLKEFIPRLLDYQGAYNADAANISGFGMQFFVFGLVGYIICFILIFKEKIRNKDSEMKKITFITLFSILLQSAYFVFYYSPYNYRLFTLFPIIGIVLWAKNSGKYIKNIYFTKLIDIIIITCILFSIYVCNIGSLHETNPAAYNSTFSGLQYQYRTSINYSSFLSDESWQIIDKYISPQEPIAYITDFDGMTFPYFDNYMKRKIYYFKVGEYCNIDGEDNQINVTPEGKEFLKLNNIKILHINGYKGKKNLEFEDFIIDINENEVLNINDCDFTKIAEDLYYFNGGVNSDED